MTGRILHSLKLERRRPALMNRLVEDASMYKGLLHRESPHAENGVKYFKDTLRLLFVKRAHSIFLWRFFQFIRAKREQ